MKPLRLLCVVLFLGAGLWVGYLTWQVWKAGDDSKWLFLLITVFLLSLGTAPLMPVLKRQPKPEPPTSTRFTPHWFLLLALLVTAGIVLAAIVRTILRH
jgi:hypothetical protein